MDRKVEELLNKEGGKVAKKKAKKAIFLKDLNDENAKKNGKNTTTMTGLVGPKGEKVVPDKVKMFQVMQFCKNLDRQNLLMQKTDDDIIERLKKADEEKKEIFKQHEMNKKYQEKLAQIKVEEQRHLLAAKNVPKSFTHDYEMDKRTAKILHKTNQADKRLDMLTDIYEQKLNANNQE